MIQPIVPIHQKLNILDIGCGLGDLTARLCQGNPQHAVFGVDLSENAVKWGSRHYPSVRFSIGALPELSFMITNSIRTSEYDGQVKILLRLRELKLMKHTMVHLIDVTSPIIRYLLKAKLPTILISSVVKWLYPECGKKRITILGKKMNGCQPAGLAEWVQ